MPCLLTLKNPLKCSYQIAFKILRVTNPLRVKIFIQICHIVLHKPAIIYADKLNLLVTVTVYYNACVVCPMLLY